MARNWLAAGFSRTYRRVSECSDRRRPIKRSERQEALACESLEGRVVLSDWGGGSLLASLNYVGVVTSPVVTSTQTGDDAGSAASQSAAYQQLNKDLQTLATEFQTLAGNSLVTVADLQSLATDTQAIAQAGFHFNSTTLQPVISELATAVVTPGSSTTTALNDFTALFGSSSGVSFDGHHDDVHRSGDGHHAFGRGDGRLDDCRGRTGRHPDRPVGPFGWVVSSRRGGRVAEFLPDFARSHSTLRGGPCRRGWQ